DPLLKLSFSHVVLNNIANVGKFFMTNLIDGQGSTHQVETLPTPLVASYTKMDRVDYYSAHFDRFRKTLLKTKHIEPDDSYSSIGLLVARLVVTSPLKLALNTAELSNVDGNATRYRLTSSQRGKEGEVAAAAAAAINATLPKYEILF
ncbi:hypothetical protein PFISCL1PPCAC_22006, partial [Pristionchus fissidentatus]